VTTAQVACTCSRQIFCMAAVYVAAVVQQGVPNAPLELTSQRSLHNICPRARPAAIGPHATQILLHTGAIPLTPQLTPQPTRAYALCRPTLLDARLCTPTRWDEHVYDRNAWQLPRKPYDPAQGRNFEPGMHTRNTLFGRTRWRMACHVQP
jgi:hypothetical protein